MPPGELRNGHSGTQWEPSPCRSPTTVHRWSLHLKFLYSYSSGLWLLLRPFLYRRRHLPLLRSHTDYRSICTIGPRLNPPCCLNSLSWQYRPKGNVPELKGSGSTDQLSDSVVDKFSICGVHTHSGDVAPDAGYFPEFSVGHPADLVFVIVRPEILVRR